MRRRSVAKCKRLDGLRLHFQRTFVSSQPASRASHAHLRFVPSFLRYLLLFFFSAIPRASEREPMRICANSDASDSRIALKLPPDLPPSRLRILHSDRSVGASARQGKVGPTYFRPTCRLRAFAFCIPIDPSALRRAKEGRAYVRTVNTFTTRDRSTRDT